ncbi:hypothetical protein C2G38_2080492 [Gigaspora rosea]|uniref:Uncharacterized protein n=1 Tax=Gigaspora rosea TaxID=44941 RepID=A0A397VN16_9GLOM|nr:hypothetical protein C2G38_2080492 [Gigaspora rosea]
MKVFSLINLNFVSISVLFELVILPLPFLYCRVNLFFIQKLVSTFDVVFFICLLFSIVLFRIIPHKITFCAQNSPYVLQIFFSFSTELVDFKASFIALLNPDDE